MSKVTYIVNLDGTLVTPEDVRKASEMCDGCCYLDKLDNAVNNQNVLILHSDQVFILNCDKTKIWSYLAEAANDAADLTNKLVYFYA